MVTKKVKEFSPAGWLEMVERCNRAEKSLGNLTTKEELEDFGKLFSAALSDYKKKAGSSFAEMDARLHELESKKEKTYQWRYLYYFLLGYAKPALISISLLLCGFAVGYFWG